MSKRVINTSFFKLLFTKLKYSVKEIADEMNLGEDVVSATLNNLGLV